MTLLPKIKMEIVVSKVPVETVIETAKKVLYLSLIHILYTKLEMESREEAVIEEYYKTLHIEALTMRDMARREILPACLSFERAVADGALAKKQLGLAGGAETVSYTHLAPTMSTRLSFPAPSRASNRLASSSVIKLVLFSTASSPSMGGTNGREPVHRHLSLIHISPARCQTPRWSSR